MAKQPSKAAAKKTAPARTKPRRIKQPTYKSLRLQKRIKHPVKLPSVWTITRNAATLFWQNRGLFTGITLLYGVLTIVLVRGFASGTDVSALKHDLGQIFTGNFASLSSSLSVFVVLVGSTGNTTNGTAGAYQLFLTLTVSLAIIWAIRQVTAGTKVRVRDAYYRGMYPLVPFILVLIVIALQLLPMIIGSTIYSLVIDNGIAVYAVEKLVWGILFGLLIVLTLYMLSSSLFALYIVTLPEMSPLLALRSARNLVRNRRWTVLRKILFMPIVLMLGAMVIMLPIIIWLTPLTQWVFFALTMFLLVAVHGYMYTLYRELLNE